MEDFQVQSMLNMAALSRRVIGCKNDGYLGGWGPWGQRIGAPAD